MVLYYSQAMVERMFGPGIRVEDIVKQSIARRPPPCLRSIVLVMRHTTTDTPTHLFHFSRRGGPVYTQRLTEELATIKPVTVEPVVATEPVAVEPVVATEPVTTEPVAMAPSVTVETTAEEEKSTKDKNKTKTWASVLARRLAEEHSLVIDDIPSSTTKVTIRDVRRKLEKIM